MVANQILQLLLSGANRILPREPVPESAPVYPPQNVLVIASRFIGDNILLIPFFKNLRQGLGPDAMIDVVAPPVMTSLLDSLGVLNTVYPEKPAQFKNPDRFLKTHGYDTVLFCRYTPVWGSAALRAGIPQRIGFDLARLGLEGYQRWGDRLTHAIPSTGLGDARPQIDIYQDFLRLLGLPVADVSPGHILPLHTLRVAQDLLDHLPSGPRVLIHATSGSPGKHWPMANWQQLLSLLDEMFSPVFLATGSHKDHPVYAELSQNFQLANLCGQTSLMETLALLQGVDLVITLDTAMAHMAALAGVPRLVILYGPTNHRKWRPWTQPHTSLQQVHLPLPCRPCPARTCAHKACIRHLAVGHVLAAVEQSLRERPLSPSSKQAHANNPPARQHNAPLSAWGMVLSPHNPT